MPRLSAEPTKLVALLILNHNYTVVIVFALLEESYETASVLVKTKYALPFALPVEVWEAPYQI